MVLLLNNAGGGIFRTLPIASHVEVFSPYFDTPHAHRFSQVQLMSLGVKISGWCFVGVLPC